MISGWPMPRTTMEDDHVASRVGVQVRAHPAAQGHDREAAGHQRLGVQPAHQARQQRRQEQLHEAVEDQAVADLPGVETLQLGQVVGHQEHQAEGRRAEHRHRQAGHAEVVAAQQAQVDERPRAPQLALYEEQQGEHGEDGEGADEAGLEPVAAATFLQHDLQRAEAGDHRADAEPVGLAQAFAVAVAGADRPGHRGQQGDPWQQLQEKDPAPGIGIRQPAADRRAGGLGTLLERLNSAMPRGIRLDGSSVRISCIDSGISTAPKPLDHPDQDQRRQVRRQRAAQRTEQEHQRAEEHHPAQGEHFHQPGGKRDHADFRDQIGGGDP